MSETIKKNRRALLSMRRHGFGGVATLTGGLFGIVLLALGLMFGVVGQVFAEPPVAAVTLELAGGGVQPAVSSTDMSRIDEEPARYSFASVQGTSSFQVVPGGEAEGVIRFYNIDGNRVTHIALKVSGESRIPGGWVVEIDPPLHDEEVRSDDATVIITENLSVEPAAICSKLIEDVPDGVVCLTVPGRGYVLAQLARVVVRVPESERAGVTGDIKITAVASWLGQRGAGTISQTRDFDFNVRTRVSS